MVRALVGNGSGGVADPRRFCGVVGLDADAAKNCGNRLGMKVSWIMVVLGRLRKQIDRWLKRIGPGFITGAADDDPSGVATYSIAGAQFGYSMLWMSLFLIPPMIAIQEMCGRIGLVTGSGLAGVIKKHYPKKLLWFAVMLLFVANVINIGADLGIMASSLQMLFGLGFYFWLIVTAIFVVFLIVFVSYNRYSAYLKWFGLTLLVYLVTAFVIKQDWLEIFSSLLIPRIQFNAGYLMTMIGFMGTTISPYLFFWQASEEVEEEILDKNISDFDQIPTVNKSMVRNMRRDTNVGMIFSSIIAFFIVITTAATLNKNGIIDISTPQMAAQALRPLAGDFAYILFAIGIIGIGLQSIPVLAGSVAYAVSEAMGIKEGLSKKFLEAKGFYLIISLATLVGVLMNLLGINTMAALYYTAVINGVIAVPLIYIIIKVASDKKIVGEYVTGRGNNAIAWFTFLVMAVSVVLMLGSALI